MREVGPIVLALALAACGTRAVGDAGAGLDAGLGGADASMDADVGDAATGIDAGLGGDAGGGELDAGAGLDAGGGLDAGATLDAGGGLDAGPGADAGFDAGPGLDAGFDAGFDAGARDAGPGTGGCISGATGTHVVRFQWAGTTSGSTAYVRYEANTLPDTSRWRVTAASRSIGYRPVFADPFLGEGGLDLSGTVFIDVELSTSGLSSVRNATLAIYGRSYNTTASGSFSWMSFSGSGATPSGFVSNVAPYRWYAADATGALPAGDSGTLLRIEAGPPSNALIVARVEICFDAI